jgi:hypothetical protein
MPNDDAANTNKQNPKGFSLSELRAPQSRTSDELRIEADFEKDSNDIEDAKVLGLEDMMLKLNSRSM